MSDGIRAVVYTNGNIEYYLAGLRQHSPSKTIAQTPKLSEDKGYGLYLGEGNKTGDYKSFSSEFRPCFSSHRGTGTPTDPWIVTQSGVVLIENKKLFVTADISYVKGAIGYRIDYYIRPDTANSSWFDSNGMTKKDINFYYSSDTYIGGDDKGLAYTRGDKPNGLTTVGVYRNANSPNHGKGLKNIAHAVLTTSNHPFTSYYSAKVGVIHQVILGKLSDVVTSKYIQDNGIAVNFNLGRIKKGETKVRSVFVGFSTKDILYKNSLEDDVLDMTKVFDGIVLDPKILPSRVSTPVNVEFVHKAPNLIYQSGKEGDSEAPIKNIKIRVSGGYLQVDQLVPIEVVVGNNTTATLNTDFKIINNSILIPAGDYSTPVDIPFTGINIIGNTTVNPERKIALKIDTPCASNLIIKASSLGSTLVYKIEDDDGKQPKQIRLSKISEAKENTKPGQFEILLSNDADVAESTEKRVPIFVDISGVDGASFSDFEIYPLGGSTPVQLTNVSPTVKSFEAVIPANTKKADYTVKGISDNFLEKTEKVKFEISNTGVPTEFTAVSSKPIELSIFDQDYNIIPKMNLITPPDQLKEDSDIFYRVSLINSDDNQSITNLLGEDISIDFLYGGSITPSSDLSETPSNTAVIPNGSSTSARLVVKPFKDNLFEGEETLEVRTINISSNKIPVRNYQNLRIPIKDADLNPVSCIPTEGNEVGRTNVSFPIVFSQKNDTSADIVFELEWSGRASFEDFSKISINGEEYSGSSLPTEVT